jgi:NitT/TauT family transport system substrate-binding protein
MRKRMMKYSLFSLLLATFGFVGCSNPDVDANRIRVQLDWFPEPQHGGLYQALARGYFADEGLNVELLPGGTNIHVLSMVATGQAEIGQTASLQTMQGVLAGMPIVTISTQFHRLPSVLLMHEENTVREFPDLNGKTIMGRVESPYIPYLKKKYGIDFDVMDQTFTWGQFLADKQFIQEGYFIAEPYNLIKQGANVRWLALWDSGYEGMATLCANLKWLEQHPEQARAFLRALERGWISYLNEDPTPAHELMKQQHPQLEDGFLAFSRDMIIQENLVTGDPDAGDRLLWINLQRIQRQIEQMESVGVFEPGSLTVDKVATNRYIDSDQ